MTLGLDGLAGELEATLTVQGFAHFAPAGGLVEPIRAGVGLRRQPDRLFALFEKPVDHFVEQGAADARCSKPGATKRAQMFRRL